MRSIALIALLTGWFCCVGSALADTEAEIKAALDYRGYYHSDFVLVTPQGPVSLAQRNADIESITRSGEDRGELSYSGVKVRPLGDDHALAWGELRLAFKDGSSIDSWFSTVYVKTPFGWKAVLTHQ
jgi:hypothetical protein